jgi:hypothetical protein
MTRTRTVVLVGGLIVAGACVSLAGADGQHEQAHSKLQCGEERWGVKTLSDARAHLVDFDPQPATVNGLGQKPRPVIGTDTPRSPGPEQTTYRVQAQLVGMVSEDDRDVHLIIASPQHRSQTMIVEFPDVRCEGARDSIKKRALASSRQDLAAACGEATSSFQPLHGTATVTGVGFFDLIHGQTGIAPNGIELHPILSFRHAICRK